MIDRSRHGGADVARDLVHLTVVMVSDIVGSTTLRAALGERRATEVFSEACWRMEVPLASSSVRLATPVSGSWTAS